MLARAALLAALLAAAGCGRGPAGTRAPGLVLAPCRLQHPTELTSVEAQCAELAVPEDPAHPQGRQIRLFVARVAAISRRKAPDPLIVIAGGPGMAASSFYPTVAPAFARIQRDRDIVLVDQRGTGRSNPLSCRLDQDALWRDSISEVLAASESCRTELGRRADVSLYTTSIAVQDLDAVRAALGYASVNLYGVSYGTRVAQHYLRRFPAHTRSVILDGAVPPQVALGVTTPLDAQAALERIFERCRAQEPCRRRFGDPAVAYRELRSALERHPVAVKVEDPATGARTALEFADSQLASVLRLSSYTSEQAALLPLALDMARHGDFVPLASQFLLVNRTYDEVVAFGMHNSVVCSEDVPLYAAAHPDRSRLAQTFLGTAQLDGLTQICAHWPRGPVDADFHAPLVSDRPVLLLTGADDPVTPPQFAREAARGLSQAVVVEFAGMGHGQLTAPCAADLMARFVARGSVQGLDTRCARRTHAFPFFTSLAGPAP